MQVLLVERLTVVFCQRCIRDCRRFAICRSRNRPDMVGRREARFVLRAPTGSARSGLGERRALRTFPVPGIWSHHKRRSTAWDRAWPSRAPRGPLRSGIRSTPEGNPSRICAGTRGAAKCGGRRRPSRWRARCGICGGRPVSGTRKALREPPRACEQIHDRHNSRHGAHSNGEMTPRMWGLAATL